MQDKLLIEIVEPPCPLLIIHWPTGVEFEVQSGGLGCYQMRTEGFSLPLNKGDELMERLMALHPGCARSMTSGEADSIDEILVSFGIPLRVNRTRLRDCYEAWVHVDVVETTGWYLAGLTGKTGILTWQNCD